MRDPAALEVMHDPYGVDAWPVVNHQQGVPFAKWRRDPDRRVELEHHCRKVTAGLAIPFGITPKRIRNDTFPVCSRIRLGGKLSFFAIFCLRRERTRQPLGCEVLGVAVRNHPRRHIAVGRRVVQARESVAVAAGRIDPIRA